MCLCLSLFISFQFFSLSHTHTPHLISIYSLVFISLIFGYSTPTPPIQLQPWASQEILGYFLTVLVRLKTLSLLKNPPPGAAPPHPQKKLPTKLPKWKQVSLEKQISTFLVLVMYYLFVSANRTCCSCVKSRLSLFY